MWWTMLLIPTQDLLLILLREETALPVQTQGSFQSHFNAAAAEVAYLQIPSRHTFTETLEVEELQLLPQRRGGDRLLL